MRGLLKASVSNAYHLQVRIQVNSDFVVRSKCIGKACTT